MTSHIGALAIVKDKISGEVESVPVNNIVLDAPSVVKLKINRSDIEGFNRVGDDLIIQLKD